MPKKKTGQRKKHEKNKERMKDLQKRRAEVNFITLPCNSLMECVACGVSQKNRAFCYFCQQLQRLPVCGHCGKQKCINKHGDCIINHKNNHVTGLNMVGAICDFCETWICHGYNCLSVHACSCPLMDSECKECKRGVAEHGGRIFQCAFCRHMLCEDDQFEHQAMCQRLDSETNKCASCNRIASNMCLRCKVAYCDDHSKRPGLKVERGVDIPCPKCRHAMSEIYKLSVSTRKYDYGRQRADEMEAGINAGHSFSYGYRGEISDESDTTEGSTITESSGEEEEESDTAELASALEAKAKV